MREIVLIQLISGRECGADGFREGQIPTSLGTLHGEDESTCPWMEQEVSLMLVSSFHRRT